MSRFARHLLLTVVIYLSCCLNVFAHAIDNSKAKLNILANQTYQLIIDVDALHLTKLALDFNGEDAELIDKLSSLSLKELRDLLSNIKNEIQSQSFLYINDQQFPLPVLVGLSVSDVRAMLSNKAQLNRFTLALSTAGKIPEQVEQLALSFAPQLGDVILTVTKPSKMLVASNSKSQPITINRAQTSPTEISQWQTAKEYLYQGYIHIVPKGLDHILFVLALFLLARKTSTLLWQISAFTLAHTITLALGIFGIVNLPSNIVEPLIALSITYVAIENLYQQRLTRWRLPLIFGFGLLHGLGFASVLLELGLQKEQFVTSLIAFNVGVELGQLSVVLIAFALLYSFYQRAWYRQRIILPLSSLIALIAFYWFIERLM